MTDAEVQDAVDGFAAGVQAASELGFDAVELHGAHGYLLDQFFWDGTNQREDRWGGTPARRGEFVAEIVKASRQRVGADFPSSCAIPSGSSRIFQRDWRRLPTPWKPS